ncbi:hypothetical protein BD311DRAFT_391748 [Dichomitus squalens]|uniref:Uncharacterized protein n=1 Tax=Dichomitus squalens TaxID=114155 RepID=A0A4Q9N3Z4_9APHY|nr:hypothetical protein BD311DRAFT_391748 [Dichomitus squalens]
MLGIGPLALQSLHSSHPHLRTSPYSAQLLLDSELPVAHCSCTFCPPPVVRTHCLRVASLSSHYSRRQPTDALSFHITTASHYTPRRPHIARQPLNLSHIHLPRFPCNRCHLTCRRLSLLHYRWLGCLVTSWARYLGISQTHDVDVWLSMTSRRWYSCGHVDPVPHDASSPCLAL